MKNMFENNGLTNRIISQMQPGSTLIILKKESSYHGLSDWNEPIEFVLKERKTTILHNSADHYETYEVPVLIGVNGEELVVDDGFGMPIFKDYDVFVNYQSYFETIGKKVDETINKIKVEAKYIKKFQSFKKDMIEKHPEKLL